MKKLRTLLITIVILVAAASSVLAYPNQFLQDHFKYANEIDANNGLIRANTDQRSNFNWIELLSNENQTAYIDTESISVTRLKFRNMLSLNYWTRSKMKAADKNGAVCIDYYWTVDVFNVVFQSKIRYIIERDSAMKILSKYPVDNYTKLGKQDFAANKNWSVKIFRAIDDKLFDGFGKEVILN